VLFAHAFVEVKYMQSGLKAVSSLSAILLSHFLFQYICICLFVELQKFDDQSYHQPSLILIVDEVIIGRSLIRVTSLRKRYIW